MEKKSTSIAVPSSVICLQGLRLPHAQALAKDFSYNSQSLLSICWDAVVSFAFSYWAASLCSPEDALYVTAGPLGILNWRDRYRQQGPHDHSSQFSGWDLGQVTGSLGTCSFFLYLKFHVVLNARSGDFCYIERVEFKSVCLSVSSAFSQVRCSVTNDWKNMWGFFAYGKPGADRRLQNLNCYVTYVTNHVFSLANYPWRKSLSYVNYNSRSSSNL